MPKTLSFEEGCAVLMHVYHMSIQDIRELTLWQFHKLINLIPKVINLTSPLAGDPEDGTGEPTAPGGVGGGLDKYGQRIIDASKMSKEDIRKFIEAAQETVRAKQAQQARGK